MCIVQICANELLGWCSVVCSEIWAQMVSCQRKKCTQLNLPSINQLFQDVLQKTPREEILNHISHPGKIKDKIKKKNLKIEILLKTAIFIRLRTYSSAIMGRQITWEENIKLWTWRTWVITCYKLWSKYIIPPNLDVKTKKSHKLEVISLSNWKFLIYTNTFPSPFWRLSEKVNQGLFKIKR